MKYALHWLVFLGIVCVACRPEAPPADLSYRLDCVTKDTVNMPPRHTVYLLVEGYKTNLATLVQCDSIAPSKFAALGIPAAAERALGGRWAGIGTYLYLQRQTDSLVFYRGEVDEMIDTTVRWYPWAVYSKAGLVRSRSVQ